MPRKKCIEIVLDVETTGLDYTKERMVEFAAIRLENGKMKDRFETLINPEQHIRKSSIAVHGITEDDVKDAPTEAEVLPKILEFIGDYPIVAHNAIFDYSFLNEAKKRVMGAPLENPRIDTQAMFKEMRSESEPQPQSKLYATRADAADNSYYQKNRDSISESVLSNGIHLYTKQNPLSEQTSLVLSLKGGKYNSNDDNGFEEVMTNLLAGLIQKKLLAGQEQGLITGATYVTSKTGISSSQIIIEFDSEDTVAACRLIADSIIYGEIAPADADRAVSSRKYRKRLENGTVSNQLFGKMIGAVYGKGPLYNIYEAEKEILLDTDYTKILAAYPALLDASRYTLIATGKLDEKLPQILNESLGLLTKTAAQIKIPDTQTVTSAERNLSFPVQHTFLTDIPAEKAGPMPAVLIPTTEFLDPVIYALEAPEQGTKEAALYNAVLSYIGTKLSANNPVTVQLPSRTVNLGVLTIQNVAHTREMDAKYKNAVQSITDSLNHLQANEGIVRDIKNNWVQKEMKETGSNSGTALLMQKGLELADIGDTEHNGALWYLDEYEWIQNATVQDFAEILSWFPTRAKIRVYSCDSKK